jgi:cytochrome c-type biogenesis protein CcmH/NrfF
VQIAVRQAEGNRDPEVLDRGSRRYQHFIPWKPRRPGRYIVRWTFNGSSYREAPVRVTA